MRIIETDIFGGDYPDEKFLNLPSMTKDHAMMVAAAINAGFPSTHRRFWRVVPDDYRLVGGFEP